MGNFVNNTAWILGGNVFKILFTFWINIITTRYLGPENFGIISYVQSYVVFLTAIIGMGLNGVIIYEFINHKEEQGKILGTSIIMRFVVAIVGISIYLPLFWHLEGDNKSLYNVCLLQAVQLPFLCLDTIQYWYQSLLLSKYPVIIQTVAHFFSSCYKIYLIMTDKSVEWFAFSISLDVIIIGLLYIIIYQKHKVQKLGVSKDVFFRLTKGCTPFLLTSLMIVLYGHMDKIMIRELLNNEYDVGLYSSTLAICTVIGFLPNAIMESSRPIVLEAHKNSVEDFNKKFCLMTAGIFWICVLYACFISLFANIIVPMLYGNRYAGAIDCLRIAIWYTAFSYIGSAKSVWLIAKKKNSYVFIFALIGAVLNISMNYYLIPFMGINGAALATLLTQVFVNFISPVIFKDTRGYTRSVYEAIIFRNIKIRDVVMPVYIKIKHKIHVV